MCFTFSISLPPYMQECHTNIRRRIVSLSSGLTEPHHLPNRIPYRISTYIHKILYLQYWILKQFTDCNMLATDKNESINSYKLYQSAECWIVRYTLQTRVTYTGSPCTHSTFIKAFLSMGIPHIRTQYFHSGSPLPVCRPVTSMPSSLMQLEELHCRI